MMRRRSLLATTLGAALPLSAIAQQRSTAPIRMVVPFAPGGPTDIVGRIAAQGMASALGRTIVVENRAGAGGSIGAEMVARAAPDGDTLLIGTVSTQVLNKGLYTRLTYDPVEDFVPVALLGEIPLIGVTYPSFPARTVQEFIAYAKANPGTVSYATPGVGSNGHIVAMMLSQRTGIEMVHVPFRGTAPGTAEVMAGRVHFTWETMPSGYNLIRDGALKALGVTSARRQPQLPDTPTFVESGVEDFVVQTWVAIFAPKGTPAALVNEYNKAAQQALAVPEARQRLDTLGLVIPEQAMSSDDVRAYVRREAERWLPIVASSGARAD